MLQWGDAVPTTHSAYLATTKATLTASYGYFMDLHVLVFVGFGFLMVFLKTHSWSSVGLNLLVGAFAVQLAILCKGFWHNVHVGHWHKTSISLSSFVSADFGAATVMITFGALLGKVDAIQMLQITVIEVVVWTLNEFLVVHYIKAADIGGSIVVHLFGAIFGLAASCALGNCDKAKSTWKKLNTGSYTGQMVAMVGTLFLFCYWPSFIAVAASTGGAGGNAELRCIINTLLAIFGSVVSAFCTSSMFHDGKFNMEDVLNATLAGGVAIGTAADMCWMPW